MHGQDLVTFSEPFWRNGIWTTFNVALSRAPSPGETVTVTFSAPNSDLQFRNNPQTIVFSDAMPTGLELRRTIWGNCTEICGGGKIGWSAASGDTSFNGQSGQNSNYIAVYGDPPWWGITDGNFGPGRDSGNLAVINVAEGGNGNIRIRIADGRITRDEHNIDVELVDDMGDSRVSYTGPAVITIPNNSEDWSSTAATYAVGTGDGSAGSATIRFTFRAGSGDAAQTAWSEVQGNLATAVINIQEVIVGSQMVTHNDPFVIDEGSLGIIDLELSHQPATDPVTVTVILSDNLVLSSPSDDEIVFTRENWDMSRRIRISYPEDDIQGDPSGDVRLELGTNDANYTAARTDPYVLPVALTDNDTVGLAVAPAGSLDVNIGNQIEVQVQLTSEPTGAVAVETGLVIDAVPAGIDIEATPMVLNFDASNWSDAQDVVIRAAYSDPLNEVDVGMGRGISLQLNPSSSADANYNALDAVERAGMLLPAIPPIVGMFVVTTPDPFNVPEGGSAAVGVVLTEQPATHNVTVTLEHVGGMMVHSPSDPKHIFTRDNWNLPRQFVLTVADDNIQDLDTAERITLKVLSNDPNYSDAKDNPQEFDVTVIENDVAALSVSPSGDLRLDVGESLTLRVALATEPTAAVNVARMFTATSVPAGIEVALAPGGSDPSFSTTDWNEPQDIVITAGYTDPANEVELEDDIEFELELDASSSDAAYDDLDVVRLSGAVSPGGPEEAVHTSKAVGASSLGATQFALDVVGEQVGAGIGGLETPALRLASPSASAGPDGDWAQMEGGWRSDFGSLVGRGSGFSLPLDDDGRYLMWARVGLSNFDGTSAFEDAEASYDGDQFGGMLGVSRYDASGRVMGIAVSRTGSETDLEGSGDLVSTEQDTTAVHPYFGMQHDRASRVWVLGSLGRGEIEASMADGTKVKADTSSRAAGAGFSRAWEQGELDLALRIEGAFGESELEQSAGFTAEGLVNEDDTPLSSEFTRIRTEVEVGLPYMLPAGGEVHPYMLLGARYDGGDLGGDVGVEAGGGLRARIGNAYHVDLRARFQVNDSDHNEHSFGGRVTYDPAQDRRGLTGSVSRGLGEDGAVEGTVGYGWGTSLFGQQGVIGPSLIYEDERTGAKLGFDSDRLRMHVRGGGGEDEVRLEYTAVPAW